MSDGGDSRNPKLRVLDADSENVERLRVGEEDLPFGEPMPMEPMPARSDENEVTILQPSIVEEQSEEERDTVPVQSHKGAAGSGKSTSPDVKEILPSEVEEVDTEDAWGSNRSFPVGWFVLALTILVIASSWALMKVFESEETRENIVQKHHEVIESREREDAEVKETLRSINEAINGYLTARSIDDKLKFVRHPQRVKPLMERYYGKHQMKAATGWQFGSLTSLVLDRQAFCVVAVELADGGNTMLLIEQVGEFEFKIDWEAAVCYLPIEWEKYLETRPTERYDLRLVVTPDNFYAYQFKDEAEYQCFKLESRQLEKEGFLYGYVKRDSQAGKELIGMFNEMQLRGGGKREPLILKIRFPEAARSKNCVVIEELVAKRWSYIKSPDPAESSGK